MFLCTAAAMVRGPSAPDALDKVSWVIDITSDFSPGPQTSLTTLSAPRNDGRRAVEYFGELLKHKGGTS